MICLEQIQKFYNMTNLSTYRKKKNGRWDQIKFQLIYYI